MTAFLVGAGLLVLLAVLFIVLPLLRGGTAAAPAAATAIVSTLALVAVSAIVYSALGNPAGLRLAPPDANGRPDLADLNRRVARSPDDRSAWLALGQAYGSSGQFPAALHAYSQANTLAGGKDAAALAGIGEALYLQGNGAQNAQAAGYFERALQVDPKFPKGLFYSALIAYQAGQLQLAHDRFAAMLTITPPPPPNVRAELTSELQQIEAQLHPPVDVATAIRLNVSLAPALATKVPANAALFVYVQAPGGGPPLAARRVSITLPQEVDLSADDAMIKERAVHPGQKVTVVARISASGSPLAQPGDLYGQIDDYVAGKTGARPLEIDKLSP